MMHGTREKLGIQLRLKLRAPKEETQSVIQRLQAMCGSANLIRHFDRQRVQIGRLEPPCRLQLLYSEDSFFWRESKRWRYFDPSSLYDQTPPLKKSSQTCARLLPSFFAISISVLLSSAGTLTPILSSFAISAEAHSMAPTRSSQTLRLTDH